MTSTTILMFTLVIKLSKSAEKSLAYYGLLNLWNKHFISLQGDAKWNFEHNSGHKQNKLLKISP